MKAPVSKKQVICPICWHRETLTALGYGDDAVRYDVALMSWQKPPGGPRGQVVTALDQGYWRCEVCGVRLPPDIAAVVLDAVLRVSDSDSDSYDGETFKDARIAAAGG
jgi:hypothetical protein